MNFESLREYCLSMPGTEECFPFDDVTLVFKVMGKMFALTSDSEPLSVNLKCEPERAEMLRAIHRAVKPGYHMNKRHWNTVILDGSIPEDEIKEMIDTSYDLVVVRLPKAERELIEDCCDVIESRRRAGETSVSFEEVLADLRKAGRL